MIINAIHVSILQTIALNVQRIELIYHNAFAKKIHMKKMENALSVNLIFFMKNNQNHAKSARIYAKNVNSMNTLAHNVNILLNYINLNALAVRVTQHI